MPTHSIRVTYDTLDLDGIKDAIEAGINGDDRFRDTRGEALSALAVLIAEVGRLRGESDRERAAVVTWLRSQAYLTLYEASPWDISDAIERGEHRHEGEKS